MRLKFDVEGSDEQIREALQKQLRAHTDNPLSSWRWWSGFMWGAILIAALDYGDVWVCVGSCGDAGQSNQAAPERR